MRSPVHLRCMTSGRLAVLLVASCASATAQAQLADVPQVPQGFAGVDFGAASGRAFDVVPRVSTDMVWSDNAKRGSSTKESEFTTTVSPGVRAKVNGQRLSGNLDYSLTRVMRARNTSADETQQSLRSAAELEAVEDRVFVDYAGTISQRAISAFGQQTDDPYGANTNRTEVRTFRLAPRVQGRLGDWADYRLRYSTQTSRSKSSLGSDQDSQQFNAGLNGSRRGSWFSWNVDASRMTSDFKEGREIEADQLRAVLGYQATPEVRLSVIPGWESNNYATPAKDSRLTWGVGADWMLDRTKLSALIESRFFGRAHTLSFEHRSQRTAWKLRDSKNLNVTPEQSGRSNLGALYDLLFFQFESIEPDPVRRATLVESFLLANGLNGQTQVEVGFLASGATVQRRQDLSFTLIGLRETLSAIATQTRSSSLFNTTLGSDDFSNSSFVRQQSFSLSYARRLMPGTSMNAVVTRLRSQGSLSTQSTTLMTYNLSLSTDLGRQTTASIGLRRAEFDSSAAPYTENSIRGGVTVRF